MSIPNTETLLPSLLSQYLHSRRADMSLPPEDDLPFVVGPTAEAQKFPRVLFVTSSQTFPHPKRTDLQVTIELQVSAEGQEIPEENIWAAGIRYAFSDRVSFFAWLAALPIEERTGWEIRKCWLVSTDMAVDDSAKVRGRSTVLQLHARSDELAPVA